jgi:hypothetical protein
MMPSAASAALSISATELARSANERKGARSGLLREFEEMSRVMVEEEGLLNHSQAALVLDITPARVTELVNLGKLKRFDFLGRTYVSVKEVRKRRDEDIKAGRPARSGLRKWKVAAKIVGKSDLPQILHGGPIPDEKKAKKPRKKK